MTQQSQILHDNSFLLPPDRSTAAEIERQNINAFLQLFLSNPEPVSTIIASGSLPQGKAVQQQIPIQQQLTQAHLLQLQTPSAPSPSPSMNPQQIVQKQNQQQAFGVQPNGISQPQPQQAGLGVQMDVYNNAVLKAAMDAAHSIGLDMNQQQQQKPPTVSTPQQSTQTPQSAAINAPRVTFANGVVPVQSPSVQDGNLVQTPGSEWNNEEYVKL